MSQHDTLTQALQEIAAWNSHTTEFAVDYGSNGVRDFYRRIARAALSVTQPAQAGWCPGCSPDNCQGCGPAAKTAQAAQGAGEVVRDYYQELLTARGAVQELEQKVFSQEQAIAILRTCVASHQRDMADPPAYLQDAVIKAAGLGAMAEQIAELKRQATHTPTQPAAGADVLDAKRYRWLRRKVCAIQVWNFSGEKVSAAEFEFINLPRLEEVPTKADEALDSAIDAAIAASGRRP